MKRIFGIVCCFSVLLGGMTACNKNASSSGKSKAATLTLSTSVVKKGQPVGITLSDSTASVVHWTISPSGIANIASTNNKATILFAESGSYKITAVYGSGADSASDSASSPISVSDSVYTPTQSGNFDTVSMAGVQITLKPSLDTTGHLVLLALSNTVYTCFPSFIWGDTVGVGIAQGTIGIGFIEIVSGSLGGCPLVLQPATSYIFTQLGMTGKLPNGTYPIRVSTNGVYYEGTYTVTSTGYTFNWPYTSGVTIAPAQVNY